MLTIFLLFISIEIFDFYFIGVYNDLQDKRKVYYNRQRNFHGGEKEAQRQSGIKHRLL